jgi:glycosyltransferase involved in cell wall biosynthesis
VRIFLISNCFGIFIEKFIEEMEKRGVVFSSKSVMRGIKGKKKLIIVKAIDYIILYINILVDSIFKRHDVFYVHFPLQTAPIIYLIRFFSTKKMILNFHGSDLIVKSGHTKILQFFTKKLVSESDIIVVPSSYLSDELKSVFDVDHKKIFISPSSGINFDVFNRNETKRGRDRKYTAGYISRIDDGKGWDVFIKAIASLKEEGMLNNNEKFLILGSGEKEKERSELIESLGIQDIVDIKGRVERIHINRYYRELKVFVFPSFREGLGLVGLEAMACGISVIGSNIGGISSYLEDGVNGLFFKKGDHKDLSEKLKVFMKMTEIEKITYEENAFETASKFEEGRVAGDLLSMVEKTVFPWKVGEING